ncbi:MAG: flagellin [Lachnospiraceae bacterium]|nr:flagellin [Lachnospiraceae bacterium]
MVVQHNLTAMNSNRMLGITQKTQAKATEKLSSGYKINRAADDAAGLSISEKMRKQIRGLTQASANAQDGISAVQTAEGALTEVHDMLQRMNELAVKAANGTNSEDDRNYIQAEVNQLVTEIDRVSTTTKFNETYLLKGTNGTEVGKLSYAKAAAALKATGSSNSEAANIADDKFQANQGTVSVKGSAQSSATNVSGSDATHGTYKKTQVVINGTTYTYLSDFTKGTATDAVGFDDFVKSYKSSNSAEKVATDLSTLGNLIKANNTADLKEASVSLVKDGDANKLEVKLSAFADLNKGLDVSLHVGADSTKDNKIGLTIEMMSARGLGVNGLEVSGSDDSKATAAIDTIKAAIQKVSEQRSALGAVQNRLDHTINNLDNVVENTTSAESAIRDTDMAKQMVSYSNNNILAQAGQAMLAQANQSNQGVLSLLR